MSFIVKTTDKIIYVQERIIYDQWPGDNTTEKRIHISHSKRQFFFRFFDI